MDLRTLTRILSMAGACVNVISASFKERLSLSKLLPFVFPLINLDDSLPYSGKMITEVVCNTQSGNI